MVMPDSKPAPDLDARQCRKAYAARIDAVIDYIGQALDGDLSVQRLSEVAHFSTCHFHRQFTRYTGITVARLVRLLRLRRASMRLAFNPHETITQIALEAGYENPESFSRAFKQAHGQSPSAFRKLPQWQNWQVRPLTNTQERTLNTDVELVDFATTRVAAVEYQGPEPQSYTATMKLVAWRREHGVGPQMGRTFGVHYSDPNTTPPAEYRLDVCVSYERDVLPNAHDVVAKEIDGGRCAKIRHLGSRSYIAEADYLYREWLPASGEELRDFPMFFHYVNVGPDVREADMITDVYLPLL